jgi:hypothetical protein
MIDIYLACPYCHEDPAVKNQRVNAATYEAAKLIKAGFTVFNPIGHAHKINSVFPDITIDWLKFDLVILAICRYLYVLALPGWSESKGVQREITLAKELGKEIRYIDV